jgi:hypothetical protein
MYHICNWSYLISFSRLNDWSGRQLIRTLCSSMFQRKWDLDLSTTNSSQRNSLFRGAALTLSMCQATTPFSSLMILDVSNTLIHQLSNMFKFGSWAIAGNLRTASSVSDSTTEWGVLHAPDASLDLARMHLRDSSDWLTANVCFDSHFRTL